MSIAERDQGTLERGESSYGKDAMQRNQNLNAEFNNLSRDEQLRSARELSQGGTSPGADSSTKTAPRVYTNDDLGRPLTPSPAHAPEGDNPADVQTNQSWDQISKQVGTTPTGSPELSDADKQQAQLQATAIENAARVDLHGDQADSSAAGLDVRLKIEDLNNDSPAEKNQVLDDIVKDGSRTNIFDPMTPHAEITLDENGNPDSIRFSTLLTTNKGYDDISLKDSVCKQAEDAYSATNKDVIAADQAHGDDTKFWFEKVINQDGTCKPESDFRKSSDGTLDFNTGTETADVSAPETPSGYSYDDTTRSAEYPVGAGGYGSDSGQYTYDGGDFSYGGGGGGGSFEESGYAEDA